MSTQGAYATTRSDFVEELVRENLGLVKRVAQHLCVRLPSSVQLEDLTQAGLVGLLEAAHRYTPATGATFSTFAVPRIRGAMLDELRKGDWIPRSVHRRGREVAVAIRTIEHETGREARSDEIAAQLGITTNEYEALLVDLTNQNLISLDELVANEARSADVPSAHGNGPMGEVEREQMIERLAALLEQLPEREQMVLSLYYDEELTLKEIAQLFNVSQSRVSQLLSQARLRLSARIKE